MRSFLLLSLVLSAVVAAPSALRAAEVWSLVEVPSDLSTQALLRQLDVDVEGGHQDRLHVLIRATDLHLLEHDRIPYVLLHADHASLQPQTLGERGLSYHDPQGVLYSLQAIAEQYPDVARYVALGRSTEGRTIGGLLLSDQPGLRAPDEPSLRLLGGHHGDEYSSVEVALDVAWTLAERYTADDPAVRDLLDRNEVWIAPLVNPDGHVAFTRRNSNNVDINRNYSYLWSSVGPSGEAPFDQAETAAIRALSINRSFHHSVSLHSGATNLGWVWNSDYEPTPEEPWMEGICGDYWDATEDPDFWVTNGADWYLSFGDTNDWSYGVRGGHDYTLEVSSEKTPKEEHLPAVLDYHTAPAIDFLSAGTAEGLFLRITDSSGRPLEAEVEHSGSGWVGYSDPETGIFARPTAAGSPQVLTISAQGYPQATVTLHSTQPPQLSEVVLSVHPETVPSRIDGAEFAEDTSSILAVCSPRLGKAQGEVEVLISREGPFPAVGTRAETKAGTPCVSVKISPRELIADSWRREGEWNLVVRTDTGESLALLPGGVLITAAEPGFSIHAISIEESSSDDQTDLLLEGVDLARGALIRAVGPDGRRVVPSARPADLDDDQYRVSFATEDWSDGPWSLRIFGGGHWLALPSALVVEDGVLTAQDLADPKDPEPEPPVSESPPPPGVLGGAGCTCAWSGNADTPPGVPGLAFALLVGYSRRRRRNRL
jgi:carboxypeptidase T